MLVGGHRSYTLSQCVKSHMSEWSHESDTNRGDFNLKIFQRVRVTVKNTTCVLCGCPSTLLQKVP